jgi:hypothetical protein
VKTSTLSLIGVIAGSVAVGSNIWSHNWATAIWAGASALWALSSYDLARKLGR